MRHEASAGFFFHVQLVSVSVCSYVRAASCQLTQTLKLVGGSGEQQLALHAAGSGTAGDTGLLIAALHPVRQPEQTAVTVQRVGSNRSDRRK